MRRKLFILAFVGVWLTSLVPIWDAKASRRERLRVDLVDTLDKIPAEARIELPRMMRRMIRGETAESLVDFIQSPEFKRLSDDDVAGLAQIVRAAYRGTASLTWRERAAEATQTALDATWKKVDDTIGELFRSAPNIE